MGSECKPSKFHYDITMSKRTRKPSNVNKEATHVQECESAEENAEKVSDGQKENDTKKSLKLKELIEGRSLNQHFTEEEENQLQLSIIQQEGGFQRVKLKRMVSRYAKVLSHLIKLKKNPEKPFRKKPLLQLTN